MVGFFSFTGQPGRLSDTFRATAATVETGGTFGIDSRSVWRFFNWMVDIPRPLNSDMVSFPPTPYRAILDPKVRACNKWITLDRTIQ